MKAIPYITALWCLLAGAAAAGTPDRPLTLDEAVETAVAAAPQLQAQRAAVEGAQALALGAGRLPDPSLVAGVENLPSNGVDAWSFGRDFMTMRKLGLMQSFPSEARRRSERDSARATVLLTEAQAQQSKLEVSQSVAQAWTARYAADVSLQDLLDLRPTLALQAELARAAVASGNASVVDALSAQAAVADLDDRVLDARRESAAARIELARWLGADADRPLAPPPALRVLPASDAQLLSALHHHAALRAYDAQIDVARNEIAVANAARHPDWSAELDYARRGTGFSDMVSLQFSVALPLFPGTRQDPVIHARLAALRALEAGKESERRMHEAETTAMLGEWHSARDRIDLYEQQRLPLARQRTALALDGLRAGRMELRQALAIANEELELRHSYAEQLKTLGRTWAYLRFLPSQGAEP